MKLKSLLNGIEGLKAKGNLDTDVKGITHNSKNVKEGDMFIAIKGFEKEIIKEEQPTDLTQMGTNT